MNACKGGDDRVTFNSPWKLHKLDLDENLKERAKAFGIAKMVPSKMSNVCSKTDLKRKRSSSPECPALVKPSSLGSHQAPKKFFKSKHNANMESMKEQQQHLDLKTNASSAGESGVKVKDVSKSRQVGNDAKIVDKEKCERSQASMARVDRRRSSFEVIEELKQNLSRNNVEIFPATKRATNDWPPVQDPRRRNSAEDRPISKGEAASVSASAGGRRQSTNDCGTKSVTTESTHRKKEKKDRQRPKKQGYLSQKARSQCEELHRMSRALAVVPRKPIVNQGVERFSNVHRESIDFARSREMTGSNSNGHCSIDHRRIDTENDIKSAREKNGQPTSVADDDNVKNVSSKEARNADISNVRGNPLPSPQPLLPAPSAPTALSAPKKKSKEKKRNKESSNSAERKTSSDQKKMQRKSSSPSRSKLSPSPSATEAVVTKKTSEHLASVSSLHNDEDDDGTSSAKNKEPDHRHPASQHDDAGRRNVNAVKNALIAIHEEAQEKRLAQELPGFNWLEEKLKNGGLSSGGNQYNSPKRPYNKKTAVNENSSVKENGMQSSTPASHVAGRGKQKHLTDVEKVEDHAPNTSNGSATLSINTSLSRKSDGPNSNSSTENNNCKVINPAPDAKQIHQKVSNESVTTQHQVVVQSQSECSESKQLLQSEPQKSISSQQQQDQASHQYQQYSRQELGQHPNKVMQISQQLSPNCSVPINSAGGPHQIVPAVTYVSPLPPHAMVFPSCPNMQMQPIMATDSSATIFVPVSVHPPLIASQAGPENSDISQRLCERIKKSQPINSIPAVVSMPLTQIVSNTAVFANSSSVNTTGTVATSTPIVNNLDNCKQDSSIVQGRMPEPINKPVVTEQNLTSFTTKTSSESNMQTSPRQDKNLSPSFSINQEKQCYRIERPDMVSCRPEEISFQTSSPSFCPVLTPEMNTKLSKDVVENQACMQQKSLKNQTSFEEKSGSDCKNSPKKAYDHEQINMKLNVSSSFPSGNAQMNCESNKQQVSVTPRNSDFSQASERVGNPTENAQYSYFAVKTSDQNTSVGSATSSMDVKVSSATRWVTEDWINRNIVHDKEINNLDRNVKAQVQNTNNIIFNSVQSCVNVTPMVKNQPFPPKTSHLESSEDIICIKEVSRKTPHSSEMIKSIDKSNQVCSPHMNSIVSSLQCNERNTENMEHNQHVAQKEKALNASNWGLSKMQSNKQVNEVEPFCSYEKRMTAKVAGNTEAKADLSKHLPLPTNPKINSDVISGEKVNDLKDDVLDGEHSKSPFEEELERRKRELEFLEWLARVREQEREKLMQLKREKEKMLKMMEVSNQIYNRTIVKNSTTNIAALSGDPIRKRPSGDSPSNIPEKRAVTESVAAVSTCSTSTIPSHQPPPHTSLTQTGTQVLSHTSHKQPISNPNFSYVPNIPNQHARLPMYPNLSTYPINSAQINYTNYAQGMINTTRPQQSKMESLRNLLPQQVNVGHMNNMQCNYPVSSQANVPCSTCNTIIGNEHRTGGCLIHKSTEKINTSSSNSLSHYPYTSEIQQGNKARGATEQVMPANNNSFVPNIKNNSVPWTKNPQESHANLNQLSSNYPQSKMASQSKVVHPMPLPPRLPVRPMPAEAASSPRINPSSNNNNVILSDDSPANHVNWMNRTSPIQQNMMTSKLSSGKHEPVYPQPQRLPPHNHHLHQQAQINPVMPNTPQAQTNPAMPNRPQGQINQMMPSTSRPQINPVMPNTSHVPKVLLPVHNNGRMPQIPIPTYRFQPPNISDGKPQSQQMWHPPNPNNHFLQQPFLNNSTETVTPSRQQPMAHHSMNIVCYNCQGPAQFMCSDCQQVRYCSVDCQTKDWNRHSHQCRNFCRKTMVPPHY